MGRQQRASLTTLGCRLNQSETQRLSDQLRAAGYQIVAWGERTDLAVINTCTVTRLAEAKARQVIRKCIREQPRAFVVVVGCYSQMGSEELATLKGVDLIIGNQDKLRLLEFLGDRRKNSAPMVIRPKLKPGDFSLGTVGTAPIEQRANLKIQDGCDFMCSFCIIPFARGRVRARDFQDLMQEARHQVARGVRELVLTGVNLGTYRDAHGRGLVEVVDALDAISGLDRIRISSIEPTTVDVGLLERMAEPTHALQPYLHLPMQSGSDDVLAAMRRKYTLAEWSEFVARSRKCVPGLYVGTDVMVGFPGESEADFVSTCQALEDNDVAFAHVFTYSERPGTLAARFAKVVPVPERQRRSQRLRSLSWRLRHEWQRLHLGATMEVLLEDPKEGTSPGLTANYLRVVLTEAALAAFNSRHGSRWTSAKLANRMARVRLTTIVDDHLEGELVMVEPKLSTRGLGEALAVAL